MTPDEKRKLNEVYQFMKNLGASFSIPVEVQQSFEDRFLKNFIGTSTKTAASETQAVNESGAGSYSVAKPMDGFKALNTGGTVIYLPFYN